MSINSNNGLNHYETKEIFVSKRPKIVDLWEILARDL